MRVPSSTQLKKRCRLIWGCWCDLRRSFSKMGQVANLPRYSTFLEFFGKGTQGGPCECSRPLAERSLKYPSYTNLRDRKMGAGLLIQTNRMYGRGVPLGQTHSSPTRPAQACPRRAGSPAFRAAWKHIRITFVHRKTTVG